MDVAREGNASVAVPIVSVTSSASDGASLGLAISRRIVEAHGQLTLQSSAGAGSTLTFTLRAASEEFL